MIIDDVRIFFDTRVRTRRLVTVIISIIIITIIIVYN